MVMAEFDDLTSEPRQLEPVAAEEVIPHRSGVVRRHGAHHRDRLVDAVLLMDVMLDDRGERPGARASRPAAGLRRPRITIAAGGGPVLKYS